MEDFKSPIRPNGWALLPLAVFFALYAATFAFTGSLSGMPVIVAFLLTTLVAVCLAKGTLTERIRVFCNGAANETILMMVLIFILAGAFAESATATGAVTATVNMALRWLPEDMIPASIFIAACFVSMAMGTSCGTIAALTPIAAGIAPQIGLSLPHMVGIVVGGAMFGDNLSFISDTTIVATRTQDVRMTDKFRANLWLALPAALIVALIYVWQGFGLQGKVAVEAVNWLKVAPYLAVRVAALAGMNVMAVLLLGIVLSGAAGLLGGNFTVWEWAQAANRGIVHRMGELIIVSLLAGGLFGLVRHSGGIDWLVNKLTLRISTKRRAEGSIAALTFLTDCCTANNTITLIIIGPIARQIGDTFGLNRSRIASLLDTVSCFAQGLLPYGAQLLIASGIAKINAVSIVPYLYYPFAIGVVALLSIPLRFPRKYTKGVK
jgi:Na+/H+ antiporter NhaC